MPHALEFPPIVVVPYKLPDESATRLDVGCDPSAVPPAKLYSTVSLLAQAVLMHRVATANQPANAFQIVKNCFCRMRVPPVDPGWRNRRKAAPGAAIIQRKLELSMTEVTLTVGSPPAPPPRAAFSVPGRWQFVSPAPACGEQTNRETIRGSRLRRTAAGDSTLRRSFAASWS
jgi:hypothetical protein